MGVASGLVSAWWGGQVLKGRIFAGGVGAILAVAGVWSMYSGTTHSLNGVDASAVLVERIDRCQAEFQPKGESRRKETMPCAQAYAFLKVVGAKKVRVYKKTFASVRFPLRGGEEHAATVEESKVQTGSLPIGGRFDAVYDPQNPSDVRAKLTWTHAGFNLLLVAGGLVMLALAFLGQVLRVFAGPTANPSAETHRSDEPGAASWGDRALNRAVATRKPSPDRASDSRLRGGAGTAGSPRRQFGVRA